jgi:hypothetical protein
LSSAEIKYGTNLKNYLRIRGKKNYSYQRIRDKLKLVDQGANKKRKKGITYALHMLVCEKAPLHLSNT